MELIVGIEAEIVGLALRTRVTGGILFEGVIASFGVGLFTIDISWTSGFKSGSRCITPINVTGGESGALILVLSRGIYLEAKLSSCISAPASSLKD